MQARRPTAAAAPGRRDAPALRRAVILAGGKGTRLAPLTDREPKPMVAFVGQPFAVGLVRRLAAGGWRDVTVLVGRDPAPFQPLVAAGTDQGVRVRVKAEETPLDTAGAVRRLFRGGAPGDVLVCNGDILTDLDFGVLLDAHRRADAVATIALTRVADTSSYGVVVCDGDGRVRRFVEKPPPGTEDADTVNAGTYVLAAHALDLFPGDGPLSFERTVFPQLLRSGATVLGVATDAFWADLGTPRRYLDGHWAVLEGRCAWPLPPSLRPHGDLVAVDATATVATTAALGPRVVIGASCVVEDRARLVDTVVHRRARVGAGATVGPGCIVGADAVIAPGTVVPAGTVVPPGGRAVPGE